MSEIEAIKIGFYTSESGLVIIAPQKYKVPPLVNGVEAKPLFLGGWYMIPGQQAIEKLELDGGQRSINQRWEKVNSAVACIPDCISDADLKNAGGFDTGIYAGMRDLYAYKCELEPVGYIEKPFTPELKGAMTFSNLGDPTAFRYSLGKTWDSYDHNEHESFVTWSNLYDTYDWMKMLIVSDVQKALTPQIAWHLGPCFLTSHASYKIVRNHIKTKIDPAVAEITSDYDFCFTVCKRIAIRPYNHESTRKIGRRKPQFVTQTVTYEKKTIFEMTHEGGGNAPHSGYTPIPSFTGSSLADLAQGIDAYLEALMLAINEPVVKCPTCSGCGIANYHKISATERNIYALKPTALLG